MKKYTKTWFRGTAERAIKTAAQTMLALITTGAYIWEIDWRAVLGITATAVVLSLLTSLVDSDAADTAIIRGRPQKIKGKGKHSYDYPSS